MRWIAILAFMVCLSGTPLAAPVEAPAAKTAKPSPDSPERIQMTKVQIFLDRSGFRPGKIDGLGGEFTQRAADRWCDFRGVARGSMIDLSGVAEPYRQHTIAEEDAKWVGPTASQPSQQAKLKALFYGNLWEALAERFHCDLNFLKELNPGIPEPAVGMVVRVPDVEDFRMADVKALQKARSSGISSPMPSPLPIPFSTPPPTLDFVSEAAFFTPGDSVFPQPAAPAEPTPAPTSAPTPEPSRRLVLLRDERLIEVYENDHIAGCFPCTPGSSKFPVPLGTWRVTSNILMPNFRWDKSVLETGVRSNNAYNLPPGPNSPVGIVWMGINRPSLGMHGTNSPDRIGRNESSGCIRLANWDAFRLCQLVGKGVALEVR